MKRKHIFAAAMPLVVGTTLIAAIPPVAAAPTPRASATRAATVGIFGTQDPTYNGVMRQGLAILALRSQGRTPSRASVAWLVRQQCSNGGFEAYRPDPRLRCHAPNPMTYSGEDTNSTAVAALALNAVGKTRKARRAVAWTVRNQSEDGGWAYYPAVGAASDSNSTGLVLWALTGVGRNPRKIKSTGGNNASRFLRRVQLPCGAASSAGAVDYQAGPSLTANDSASAQVGLGLAGLKLGRKARRNPPTCGHTSLLRQRAGVIGYLQGRMLANAGAIPAMFGPGVDSGSTAYAIIALSNAGGSRSVIRLGVRALRAQAPTYLRATDLSGAMHDDPGALALYILATNAAGSNPRNFGGTDLVTRLNRTIQAG